MNKKTNKMYTVQDVACPVIDRLNLQDLNTVKFNQKTNVKKQTSACVTI
jgi:hypothetical protein